MRAIILAAGRGSRLKELTDSQPKCFLEVSGTRLIDRQIQVLKSSGIDEIAIVRGYLKEAFVDETLTYFDNDLWQESNMVFSLLQAEAWLESEACIIAYSDILYTQTVIKDLMASKGNIAISYNTNWLPLWEARFSNPLDDAESFKMSDSGNLIEIGNKVNDIREIQGQYMGLIYMTPEGWHQLKDTIAQKESKAIKKMDCTTLLNQLIGNKIAINTVPSDSFWFEFDSQEDLDLYNRSYC